MSTEEEIYLRDIAHKSDYVLTPSGGIDTIAGLKNVADALMRRLVTSKGTIIHRPDYGVGIKNFQNAISTIPVQRKLALEIQEQFEQDDRVTKVTGVAITKKDANPSTVRVKVSVDLVGYGEQVLEFIPFEEV